MYTISYETSIATVSIFTVFDLLSVITARLMGQYYFARERLLSVVVCRMSSSVTLPAGGPPGAWTVGAPATWRAGNRAADTAWRASTVTSR